MIEVASKGEMGEEGWEITGVNWLIKRAREGEVEEGRREGGDVIDGCFCRRQCELSSCSQSVSIEIKIDFLLFFFSSLCSILFSPLFFLPEGETVL